MSQDTIKKTDKLRNDLYCVSLRCVYPDFMSKVGNGSAGLDGKIILSWIFRKWYGLHWLDSSASG